MAKQTTSAMGAIREGLQAARAAARHPVPRAVLLAAGLGLFVGLAVHSFRALPSIDSPAWWALALLVLVTAPLTIALNGAEFKLIAVAAGSELGWVKSLTTSLVASLANLLPLPGAAVVRTTALVREGVPLARSAEANALAAITWLASAAILAGFGVAAGSDSGPLAPAILVVAGLVVLTIALRRVTSLSSGPVAAGLLSVEVATAFLSAVRVLLAFRVLRLSVGLGASLVISTGQVLSALIGFVPGGLGLRELLAGVLASAIDTDSSDAIASTVVDRIAGQVGLLLVFSVVAALPGGPVRTVWRELRSGTNPTRRPTGDLT